MSVLLGLCQKNNSEHALPVYLQGNTVRLFWLLSCLTESAPRVLRARSIDNDWPTTTPRQHCATPVRLCSNRRDVRDGGIIERWSYTYYSTDNRHAKGVRSAQLDTFLHLAVSNLSYALAKLRNEIGFSARIAWGVRWSWRSVCISCKHMQAPPLRDNELQ